MKIINQGNDIAKQYRKIWNKFHEIKKKAYEVIAGEKQMMRQIGNGVIIGDHYMNTTKLWLIYR